MVPAIYMMRSNYKELAAVYHRGQKLKNVDTGKEYMVLEKYADRDLLLVNLSDAEFMVALGTRTFRVHPEAGEKREGIAWSHGVYLTAMPSNIDFRALREQYGKEAR